MKPICTVMVGLPATGKSFYIQNWESAERDSYIHSTDDLIEDYARKSGMTYDEAFDGYIGIATKIADDALTEALERKTNILWDQTNLGEKKRRRIVERMKKAGYDVNCVAIMPPGNEEDIAEWKYRLANRPGKTIPDYILVNMTKTSSCPSVAEGFDSVVYMDMYGKRLSFDR